MTGADATTARATGPQQEQGDNGQGRRHRDHRPVASGDGNDVEDGSEGWKEEEGSLENHGEAYGEDEPQGGSLSSATHCERIEQVRHHQGAEQNGAGRRGVVVEEPA